MNAAASCVLLVMLAGCEPQAASLADAAPADMAPSAPAAVASATPGEPHARMAHWDEARVSALQVPCRAIAVDGPVRVLKGAFERGDDGGLERVADGGDAGTALALEGQIPSEAWLSLSPDARLVAKDPRTTRETTFLGPARVRACVDHREESWVAAGHFESAIGAGETPGAEEWVVTPLGVVRYMAAKLTVDIRAKDSGVGVGSGIAFLWLDEDVHMTVRTSADAGANGGADAGANAKASARPTALDDDGWLRVADGEVTLSSTAARAPAQAARATVDRCASLAKRARDLASTLLAGTAATDGTTAKDQMRTRRLARAACAVAGLRVDSLPPSAPRGEMSAQLEGASAAWAAPPEASSPP